MLHQGCESFSLLIVSISYIQCYIRDVTSGTWKFLPTYSFHQLHSVLHQGRESFSLFIVSTSYIQCYIRDITSGMWKCLPTYSFHQLHSAFHHRSFSLLIVSTSYIQCYIRDITSGKWCESFSLLTVSISHNVIHQEYLSEVATPQ